MGLFLGPRPSVTQGQPAPAEDAVIDAISRLTTIGDSDQNRIARWIGKQVDTLGKALEGDKDAASYAFRDKMNQRFTNPGNTPQFTTQFAAQAAKVTEGRFATGDLDPMIAHPPSPCRALLPQPYNHSGTMEKGCLPAQSR